MLAGLGRKVAFCDGSLIEHIVTDNFRHLSRQPGHPGTAIQPATMTLAIKIEALIGFSLVAF